jgi:hypothetical protein
MKLAVELALAEYVRELIVEQAKLTHGAMELPCLAGDEIFVLAHESQGCVGIVVRPQE